MSSGLLAFNDFLRVPPGDADLNEVGHVVFGPEAALAARGM
jgi:hypothetical protein